MIEASGVSDPWRIAQIGLAAPELFLEGVIVLIDASVVLLQARDLLLADVLLRQVQAADLVVLNKSDLSNPQKLQQVRAWIASVAGTVPVFETTQAALPRLLFSGMSLPFEATDPCQEPGCSQSHPAHPVPQGHEHMELFETLSIRSEYVYSVTELRQILKNMPAGVLRLKGFLRTDQHGWSELQFSGRHGSS